MDQSGPRPVDMSSLLEGLHRVCQHALAPHAEAVDRDARFPAESFAALRSGAWLSALVPTELGGMGLSVGQVGRICEVLGRYCASTAMIYAMHQIQVACLVHHALDAPFFRDYLRELVDRQLLLASATTEAGMGGDIRSSICALQRDATSFTLEKEAPVISYGESADAILVTCRRASDAPRSDQVLVLVRRSDCVLTKVSDWDTLGFRGTCSPGFRLTAQGSAEQVLPCPYARIHSQTMHPVAHLLWSSLWLGVATDALDRARLAVRGEARRSPGVTPISATRLAEAEQVRFSMRTAIEDTAAEYQRMLDRADATAFEGFGFAIRINNLKLSCSQQVVDIVGRAMLIGGIASYRNDSKTSLGRHLRDAYGAALMVNNDRILGHNATMQIVQRET
jgi:acyl-CoA dehydrogenase